MFFWLKCMKKCWPYTDMYLGKGNIYVFDFLLAKYSSLNCYSLSVLSSKNVIPQIKFLGQLTSQLHKCFSLRPLYYSMQPYCFMLLPIWPQKILKRCVLNAWDFIKNNFYFFIEDICIWNWQWRIQWILVQFGTTAFMLMCQAFDLPLLFAPLVSMSIYFVTSFCWSFIGYYLILEKTGNIYLQVEKHWRNTMIS